MSPLQPREHRSADRDDRASTDADHDADQLVGADIVPHQVALQHITGCRECLLRLYEVFVYSWQFVESERQRDQRQ